jgi:hypothetical protein
MRCAVAAKDVNKNVVTVLNLFHKNLGTSLLLACVLLLILFLHFFVIPVVARTT